MELEHRLDSPLRGFRFYDDFEISCASYQDAERIRDTLQDTLSDYELQLNWAKTKIEEMPGRLELGWVADLRRFSFEHTKASRGKIL